MQQRNKETHTKITASPLVYTNTMAVTRGRLPQRAGSPSLNGGGAATAVPRDTKSLYSVNNSCRINNPGDDYQKVLQLVLIFLEENSCRV